MSYSSKTLTKRNKKKEHTYFTEKIVSLHNYHMQIYNLIMSTHNYNSIQQHQESESNRLTNLTLIP